MVHFEYHVNDDLQIPQTVARADWYGVVGQPYVFFDGLSSAVGALSCDGAEQTYRDAIEQRIAETGGMSPVEITSDVMIDPTEITIDANFHLLDPAEFVDLQATLLVYENNVDYCCGAGGVDTWQLVTRQIYDEAILLANVGDDALVSTVIPIEPGWNPAELHVVAFLQDRSTREIIQGHLAVPITTGAGDLAEGSTSILIDSVNPNPFRLSTEIEFTLAHESAQNPVRLEIVDPAGRRVASLAQGTLEPGTHRMRWDGKTTAGSAAASGVYFVRLLTRAGSASRKFLLLE